MLSALLCWLDARSCGGEVWLRLEDLDPDRCSDELTDAMEDDLTWLGLEWDRVDRQSERTDSHAKALDLLESRGLLYPCSCSRSRIKSLNVPSPDGGFAYDNCCRGRPFPVGGWRTCEEPIRVKLPDKPIQLIDEGGLDLSQHPSREMGDPVIRRRDGAFAYHIACVVDDEESGMTRLIRGHDLASSAATQIQLQQLLGFNTPVYRHHFLFLEEHDFKMAKFHGAVGADELRNVYEPDELCGRLLFWAGVLDRPESCRPGELIDAFDWSHVRKNDMVLDWDGNKLRDGHE